jgi:hypothetical protein
MIGKNEFCAADDVLRESQGIIQTPSYPENAKNLNCSLKFTSSEKKHINVYAVFFDLEIPLPGQELF